VKIGIDAKWFYEGPPSGRNVVRNLVEQMVQQNTGHELYIFLDRRMRHIEFPFKSSLIRLIYVWGNNNLLSNLFIMPMAAWRLKLDVIVYQNFAPIVCNCRSIAFIYDVIFLSHPQYFTRKEQIYLQPIKMLSRFAAKICTISQSEKERINTYCGTPLNGIDVIHIGVSSEYKPRHQYSIERLNEVRKRYNLPDRFLLYVGRLNERKNILNLLKSIPLLNDKEIPLVLVGSYDWKMFDINAVVSKLGIEERVQLAGFVSDIDLPVVYSLASLFWFVSFEEGFGLPPLESMAAGVPVVVSDRSSLPEVCGSAGNYANPDDPQGIAETVDKLLTDKDLYADKVTLGLSRSQQFKWEYSAAKLMQCVVDVVEKGKDQ
jgi:glycosyltransferase involved in cell wall biosynthesis